MSVDPMPFASPGISLRDYFAGQILTGWLTSRESDVLLAKCGDDAEEAARQAAAAAYVVADAMLAARAARNEEVS